MPKYRRYTKGPKKETAAQAKKRIAKNKRKRKKK
jgi:hypothetical protein